jgi:hypothetical protein
MRHTKILVKVAGFPELPVGFIDGVAEVGEDDKDKDAFAVLVKAGRARCRFGVAGADEDCVEGCLKVACNELYLRQTIVVGETAVSG